MSLSDQDIERIAHALYKKLEVRFFEAAEIIASATNQPKSRRKYRAHMAIPEPFEGWIADQCEVGPGRKESVARLFASWCGYAQGIGCEPISAKTFSACMRRKGFVPFRTKHERGFTGIALRA